MTTMEITSLNMRLFNKGANHRKLFWKCSLHIWSTFCLSDIRSHTNEHIEVNFRSRLFLRTMTLPSEQALCLAQPIPQMHSDIISATQHHWMACGFRDSYDVTVLEFTEEVLLQRRAFSERANVLPCLLVQRGAALIIVLIALSFSFIIN